MDTKFFLDNQEVGFYDVLFNIDKTDEKVLNYFKLQNLNESEMTEIMNKINSPQITILCFIRTFDKFKNSGIGQKMIDEIIKKSHSPILLIAETRFDFLENWYKKNRFEVIGSKSNLPIMLRE